jgi:hypothetical protein
VRWWEAGLPGHDEDTELRSSPQSPEDEQPSIMRLLLSHEDAERLEVAPGQWYLPGTPP